MKNVSRVEKIVGPSPQISSAFTVLFLRLLLSTLVAITLICERNKNSRGGTPLKTEPELRMVKEKRYGIGLPVEKNLQKDIITWNLNFPWGMRGL